MAPLIVTVSGLFAGAVLHLARAPGAGDASWIAAGACGAALALWAIADSLRRRRMGVDVIALLAVCGALAVGEYLAAAVISVMLASGRALEGWAAGRARRDLHALLERVPRTVRRYRTAGLETVQLEAVAPGDRLLVASGDLVPVDGTVAGGPAVLDESALTGEPLPVERSAGEQIAVALTTVRAQREGRSLQDDTVQVFHITDGKATEVWTYPRDQYASDEFWS